MLERLVENWLDSAGERSYQRCFCQMLTGQGFHIVHNTEHTPLEFGKDIIAVSPEGKLVGYQLKGNPGATLKPHDFDKIRGQLEQLATLALNIPGFECRAPDECYLVTNGEIDEAVYVQLQLLNASLGKRGHAPEKIQTITRGTLLKWAKSMGHSLWPSEMEDFGNLIKILNYHGNEIFPADVFDPLLRHTLSFAKPVKVRELRRRITSAAIITSVALHSFSRCDNHYAEITAWTMFISYVMAACEKNGVSFERNGKQAVLMARSAIHDLLGELCEEISRRDLISEGDPYSEFAFYGPRLLLLNALMAVYWMWSEASGWMRSEHKAVVETMLGKELPQRSLWGEGAIPHFLAYVWGRKKLNTSAAHDVLIAAILRLLLTNKTGDGHLFASPYYTIEDVTRHQYQRPLGCDDPFEGDSFDNVSYVCESLLMILVRANLKDICKELWRDFTKVNHERVIPDDPWRFCLYRTGDEATNRKNIYPFTVEWKDLQEQASEHAAKDVSPALKDDPLFFLLFVCIFPFRASYSAIKFLHKQIDGTWFPTSSTQPVPVPIVKAPAECTPEELRALAELAASGEEVNPDNIKRGMERAQFLLWIEEDGAPRAVCTLKNPFASYKARVFKKANVPLEAANYPFEFGYAFTQKEYRKRGYGSRLLAECLSRAGSSAVYATVRTDNNGMRSLLESTRFKRLGSDYESEERDVRLELLGRPVPETGGAKD